MGRNVSAAQPNFAGCSKAQQSGFASSHLHASRQVGCGQRHVDEIERGCLRAFVTSSFSLALQMHDERSLSFSTIPRELLIEGSRHSQKQCLHSAMSGHGGQLKAVSHVAADGSEHPAEVVPRWALARR